MRRVSAGPLRGINRDLSRNVTALQQGCGNVGKLFVSYRHRGNYTTTLGLLDYLEIGCYFVRRERQRLFDLDPNHLGKFCWIDSRQTKSLREHSRNRQSKQKIVRGRAPW